MDELTKLARGRPPFVSLYLGVDLAHEDGRRRLETEWKDVRRALAEQGAPDDVLTSIDEELPAVQVPDGLGGAGVLASIRDADGNGWDVVLDEAPTQVRYGVVPALGPIIRWRAAHPTYVVVLADRTGADLIAVVGGDAFAVEELESASSTARKAAAGGTRRRDQHRSEHTWDESAAALAAEAADLAERTDAHLVVAAGDVRALELLHEHAPAALRSRLRITEHGSRAAGADNARLATEVDHLVADVAAREVVHQLDTFAERRGRHDPVADGPGETFSALRQGLVDTLLVHDDPDDDRTAWISETSPALVALEARTLRDLGVEPVEDRLIDVAIWSTLGSGGRVQLIPAHGPNVPLDGVGAQLRGAIDVETPSG